MKIYSYINKGFNGLCVGIEVDIKRGFPNFTIIGLADSSIKEASRRVQAAIRNSDLKFPTQKILINLTPANTKKTGCETDLVIAMAIMLAGNTLSKAKLKIMSIGELSLDGTIHTPKEGITSSIIAGKKMGCTLFVIPSAAQLYFSDSSIKIIKVTTLKQALIETTKALHFAIATPSTNINIQKKSLEKVKKNIFSGVIGLEKAKLALCVAAAGRHNLLLFGPPGVGKTMLALLLGQILPPLSEKEQIENKRIYECAGISLENPSKAPVRFLPINTATDNLLYKNSKQSPGEASLANNGLLILDEITEFGKNFLKTVKQLNDMGQTHYLNSYPAKFQMVATMNPCPCGKLGNSEESCICTKTQIQKHWGKLTTPLMERFDLRIPIENENLLNSNKNNIDYLEKIKVATIRQHNRYKKLPDLKNGDLKYFPSFTFNFTQELKKLKQMNFITSSSRQTLSICSVARTLADLKDKELVDFEDLKQAINFRKYGNGDYFWEIENN